METLKVIRQAFGEESMSHVRLMEWHARFMADRKWRDKVKSEVNGLFIIFVDMKETAHKEFVLAGQTVNTAYYCYVLWRFRENGEDFAPKFSYVRTGCYIMTTHLITLPFSSGIFFNQNNRIVAPNPSYFTLFPRLKIKLQSRHFDTIEVIEVKS
jgi:hypothetical protein